MRNLTIKRLKTFVGCLVKMKVYIEDHECSELLINNVPCRKLGAIKNNGEATFLIDNNEAKVFVIADKMSKNYCNEFYQLPEGEEDIVLTGKNKFNLANGNAFRFDNNTNEEALRNRRKGAQKGIAVLITACSIGFILGFLITALLLKTPGKFSCDGMTITLTSDFKEVEYRLFNAVYESEKAAVFVIKEPFTLISDYRDYTLVQYRAAVVQANNLTDVTNRTVDGLCYYTHENKNAQTGQSFTYYAFVYKTSDAFWLIQFAILSEDVADYEDDVFKWAKSVEFDD